MTDNIENKIDKPKWNQFGAILAAWSGGFIGLTAGIVDSLPILAMTKIVTESGNPIMSSEIVNYLFVISVAIQGLIGSFTGAELYSRNKDYD